MVTGTLRLTRFLTLSLILEAAPADPPTSGVDLGFKNPRTSLKNCTLARTPAIVTIPSTISFNLTPSISISPYFSASVLISETSLFNFSIFSEAPS